MRPLNSPLERELITIISVGLQEIVVADVVRHERKHETMMPMSLKTTSSLFHLYAGVLKSCKFFSCKCELLLYQIIHIHA